MPSSAPAYSHNSAYFQLWPENPGYQVYIPGYSQQTPAPHHNSIHQPQPQYSLGPSNLLRARSTTPTGGAGGVHGVSHAQPSDVIGGGGHGHGNRMLYSDLQFPVTSNYGSMKKKSQRSSASQNTNSTTVLSSAGEPSPSSVEDNNSTLPISQSMDNMHRYLPDYLSTLNGGAGPNRKTAV